MAGYFWFLGLCCVNLVGFVFPGFGGFVRGWYNIGFLGFWVSGWIWVAIALLWVGCFGCFLLVYVYCCEYGLVFGGAELL